MFYKNFRKFLLVTIPLIMVSEIIEFFLGVVQLREIPIVLGFGALIELIIWKVFPETR